MLLVTGLVGLVVACGDAVGPTGHVARVQMTPSQITCRSGDVTTVVATVRRETGQDRTSRTHFFTKDITVASVTQVRAQQARVLCRNRGLTYVGIGIEGVRDSAAVVVR
jgi:hypothetical protein